jgi:hypothetical protein
MKMDNRHGGNRIWNMERKWVEVEIEKRKYTIV